MDALLLAAFAQPKARSLTVDLGCGCGVVGFGLLLRHPGAKVIGLDVDPTMVDAARTNGDMLGFGDAYAAHEQDVGTLRNDVGTGTAHPPLSPEIAHLVVCNPPYRRTSQGRLPTEDRARALFDTDGDVQMFLDAAFFLARNRGRIAIVFSADRTAELLAAMSSRRLEPKRLRFVHGRLGTPARLVLVEGVKNSAPDLVVEPPLVLYEPMAAGPPMPNASVPGAPGSAVSDSQTGGALTADALAFCPFLACNAGDTA